VDSLYVYVELTCLIGMAGLSLHTSATLRAIFHVNPAPIELEGLLVQTLYG